MLLAFSLYNPYAMLMALRKKRIETRSWPIKHRGPIAIYATKTFPKDERDFCREEPCRTHLAEAGFYKATDLPRGYIVGVMTIADCIWINSGGINIPANWEGVPKGAEFYESPVFEYGNYAVKRTMTYVRDVTLLSVPVLARPNGQNPIWPVFPEVEREIRQRMQEPIPVVERDFVGEGMLF